MLPPPAPFLLDQCLEPYGVAGSIASQRAGVIRGRVAEGPVHEGCLVAPGGPVGDGARSLFTIQLTKAVVAIPQGDR